MFTHGTTANELVVPAMTMSDNGECSEYDQINVEPVQLKLELNTPTWKDNTSEHKTQQHLCDQNVVKTHSTDESTQTTDMDDNV